MANFTLQIFSSATFAGSITLEQSRLVTIDQLNSVLIGSILIFIFTMGVSKFHDKSADKLAAATIILALLNSMNVSVKKDGASIRTVRKIKRVYFNITLFMFITLIYKFYRFLSRRQNYS